MNRASINGQRRQDTARFAKAVEQIVEIAGPTIRRELAGLTGAARTAKIAELQAMWDGAIAERDAERVDGMPETGETP